MSMQPHRVWDLPTRIFHWAIFALVLAQWCSAEWNLWSMDWHFRLGYAVLALVLFRIAWGFVGSDSARFSRFLAGPTAVAEYAPGVLRRVPSARPGHNPLGGWAVVAMLVLLLAQSLTGLFATDDISLYGPLSERVSVDTAETLTSLHKTLTDVLVAMIALHLVAVAWYSIWKREGLVASMVSGRKRLAGDPGLRFVGLGRAVVVLGICAAAVWAVVEFGPR
jgi:cytochrome b